MKILLQFFITGSLLYNYSTGINNRVSDTASPLAAYSLVWNDKMYAACNTAGEANYMSTTEKEVIYILNLARNYPKLFATTVLAKYPDISGRQQLKNNKYYYLSLIKTMEKMEALPLLLPDEKCYESSKCHAIVSGKSGYIGHERQNNDCKKNSYYLGECCDYGNDQPLEIVLSLLIDEDVPSLGHRKILFSNYTKAGVSIQPHKKYRFTAVLDFYK